MEFSPYFEPHEKRYKKEKSLYPLGYFFMERKRVFGKALRDLSEKEPDKKVISLKQTEFFIKPEIKNQIDVLFGHQIISRIIRTRNTYTAHLGQNKEYVVSVPEICGSNLDELLDKVDILVKQFSAYQRNEKTI